MRITSAASSNPTTTTALSEVSGRVQEGLEGATPDLAFLFASPHHANGLEDLAHGMDERLGPRNLVGCVGESVLEGAREFESEPSLVLWAACLPGAQVRSGRVTLESTGDGPLLSGVPDLGCESGTLFVIGDPFSFDPKALIDRLEEESPGTQVVGGMASGARTSGEPQLLHGRSVLDAGAVYAFVPETVKVRPIVSQGCRPFGKRLVVTRTEEHLVLEIGGRPAFEKLSEQLAELSDEDRSLLQHGLHIGLAIDARKEQHRRGDFLIRNVVGVVPESQALVVADHVRAGMTVQFHLRDAASASEDLVAVLREQRGSSSEAAGGLLFTCNGRGSRLFSRPDHDAGTVQREIGALPLAGFFAAGEIGPVGGRSFLHGFTASLAVFETS